MHGLTWRHLQGTAGKRSSTFAVALRSLALSAADQKETYINKEGLKTKQQMQAQA